MTSTKNKIPTTSVALEIIFSGPLSFTLANRFNPPLPVKAPLIPSDFPLCNRERSIKITDTTINKISSILILLSDLSLFYYNKGVVKLQTVLLMRSQKNSRKAIFHDKAKYPGLEDYKTTLSGVFMEWIDEVFKSLKHKTFEMPT